MRQALNTPAQLGLILRSARKAAGLSQASAAARLGLSQSRLSQLEADPTALTVAKLLPMLALLRLELVIQTKEAGAGRAEW